MKRQAAEGWLAPASKKGRAKGAGKVGGKAAGKSGGGRGGIPWDPPWDLGVPQTINAFKVLVTDTLCAALLGSHGSVKDQIQQETGTKLVFSNRGDYFPQTSYRVLGVYADDETSILAAFDHIMRRIVELGEEERKAPPLAGPELLGKEYGEYVFRFCVTRKMCTQIIGTAGSVIKKIRQDTGAKVFIENDTFCGHRSARVIGGSDNILNALCQINELVQRECEDPDFVPFAGVVNFGDKDEQHLDELFADPGGPPAGKGGKDAGKDSGKGGKSFGGKALGKNGGKPAEGKNGGGGGALGWSSAAAAAGMASAAGKGQSKGGPVTVPFKTAAKVSGGAAPHERSVEGDIERLSEDLKSFPADTLDSQYSMECEISTAQVEMMTSNADGDNYFQYVQGATGTNVETVPPRSADIEETQRFSIVGCLPHIYTAHCMLMLRGQQLLAEWAAWETGEAQEDAVEDEDPDVLKARIAELQAMLKRAEGR